MRCDRVCKAMIDVDKELLVPLAEVPKLLPTRRGKRVHISTVFRWIRSGARGRVLDSILVGGIRYTSREEISRFLTAGTRSPEPQQCGETRKRACSRDVQTSRVLGEFGLHGRD
jgi:uncharacterized protein DUF1580